MVKSTIESIVLGALREVQRLGGHEWKTPNPDAPVIGALDGFDSLTGIEATVMVEQKLGEKLGLAAAVDLELDSIFVSSDGRKALSLVEVVSTVFNALEAGA